MSFCNMSHSNHHPDCLGRYLESRVCLKKLCHTFLFTTRFYIELRLDVEMEIFSCLKFLFKKKRRPICSQSAVAQCQRTGRLCFLDVSEDKSNWPENRMSKVVWTAVVFVSTCWICWYRHGKNGGRRVCLDTRALKNE